MATTLTQPEILLDVISSFYKQCPVLPRMGLDLRAERLKLGQTYTAHIAGMPTVATYDPVTGYKNGVQNARTLLTDMSITVDQHKHVPLKWAHLDSIKDVKREYQKVIANAGAVLAKAVMDDICSGFTAGNFSKKTVAATVDYDLDVVTSVSGEMNKDGAATTGRVMIVNTDVANVFGSDSRVTSKEYAGQGSDGNSLRQWRNVGGFAEIVEYPDLPANGEALTGFAFESRAIALLAGIPEGFSNELAAQLGIAQIMGFETITDPVTGITMAAVSWQEAGTGDLFWSPTLVWGKRLGKAGGVALSGTDVAGRRVATA